MTYSWFFLFYFLLPVLELIFSLFSVLWFWLRWVWKLIESCFCEIIGLFPSFLFFSFISNAAQLCFIQGSFLGFIAPCSFCVWFFCLKIRGLMGNTMSLLRVSNSVRKCIPPSLAKEKVLLFNQSQDTIHAKQDFQKTN